MCDANFHIFSRSSPGSSLNFSNVFGAPGQLVASSVDDEDTLRTSRCLLSLADIVAELGEVSGEAMVTVAVGVDIPRANGGLYGPLISVRTVGDIVRN